MNKIALTKEPIFSYPESRQFPFDELIERIVRELELRNWDVPGISVEFSVHGHGEARYRYVSKISGDDFKLNLYSNGMSGGINIPEMELHVYSDESGPTLYVYVGNDWESDKIKFVNSVKTNSKLYKEPRMYLKYSGNDLRVGFRSGMLLHDHDLNREYSPKGNEPLSYKTDTVFEIFSAWLKDYVFARILECPLASEKIDIFKKESKPFPENIGPFFCFGTSKDAKRVCQCKENAAELEPADRYGLSGSPRLLNLDVSNDGTIPKIAYDGFLWCGIQEVNETTPIDSLKVYGRYKNYYEEFVFRVKPVSADGVYIADNAPYEKCPVDDGFPDAERARARTIIPIDEYAGGYEQPIVLINRELGIDEVEFVKKITF